MKRLTSSLAVLAVLAVSAPRATAQLLISGTSISSGSGKFTIQAKDVTGFSQTGQFGSVTVRGTNNALYTIVFPEPGSLLSFQTPAPLTPIFSELMLRMLKEADERPQSTYAITIRNIFVWSFASRTYYLAWRSTSVEMRLNQVPTHDWALVSASIGEVSGSNYYGTLVLARRPGDPRNCHLLRNNVTISGTYLQGLLPNSSGAGVMSVVPKMLDHDGVDVDNYYSLPDGSRIIHYASRW